MSRLKQLFDFYIFSNIHVAFATFSLTKITLLEQGISENTSSLFVFFATLVSYNIIRFLRFKHLSKWFQTNEYNLYILTGVGLLFLGYFLFKINLKALLVLLPFMLMTLFYIFPIPKYSLRNIAGLKIIIIAFSWAGITVLFPIIQNYLTPTNSNYIAFFQRFLFVLTITIPFDIRDLKTDKISLKTLPQQLGAKNSKLFGVFLLILFLILEFFKSETNILTALIISLLTIFLLLKATIKQNKYYSAFYVEAIPIFWFLLILFLV